LLNVLHVGTTLTNDLGTQVEAGHWLKVDWNALIGPFALYIISRFSLEIS
jgi:hypothetical protein